MNVLLSGCLIAVSTAMLAGCHSTESASPTTAQTVEARVVESRQQDVPVHHQSGNTVCIDFQYWHSC